MMIGRVLLLMFGAFHALLDESRFHGIWPMGSQFWNVSL